MSYDYKDEAHFMGLGAFLMGIAILAVLIIGFLVFTGLTPWSMNVQRQAVQNSPAYVEGTRSTLLDQQGQYNRLETQKHQFADDSQPAKDMGAQQRQLLIQMHDEASKIPADAVPPNVKTFLDAHPKP